MKAYKGFNRELRCKGFQYEVGKEYEEPEAELCECGFHACENPLDVFHYYPPASSRYCEVEMDEVDPRIEDDSKRCSKKIRIGVEIGFKGIIDAGIKFIMDSVDWANKKEFNTKYQSAAINTGKASVATVEGEESIAIATGIKSKAKGSLGCYIVLAEWYRDEFTSWHIKHVQSAKVDGVKIKADTFYALKNGEFVEVE